MPTDSGLQNSAHFLVCDRVYVIEALQAGLEYRFKLNWGDLVALLL